MKLKLIFLSIILFSLSSCEFSFNVSTPNSDNIDFGEMPEVKAKTFENIQVIDEEFCKEYDYPLTRFAIEYPDNVDVNLHEDEYSYINFKVKKGDEIIEELSIGNTTITKSMASQSTELLEGLVSQFKTQIDSFKTEFIGKSKFNDKLEYQFNGSADYTIYEGMGYTGKYNLIIMIPIPKKSNKLKAVLVSFIANEKSDIKSFSDFQDKGVISKIWSTFRFIE